MARSTRRSDDVLVRRQPGGGLELPGEVVGVEAGDRGHLLQGRAGVEVLLDVLDHGAEPPPRQHAVPPALGPAGRRDVADQVDGQDVGQRLGGKRPPGAAARQLGVHRRHRGPEVGKVQAVQRRDRQPRRVEVERLGGDPRDQPRLQVDAEQVPAAAPAPPGRAAGRHQHDRSGGGRHVPLHPLIPQVQFLRRPNEKDEPVVGKGGRVEFRGGRPHGSEPPPGRPTPAGRSHAAGSNGRALSQSRGPIGSPGCGSNWLHHLCLLN